MADAEDVVRIWGPFLDYLKKMEVALTCSMCSNVLEKPTLLPCNHVFCSVCIDRATKNFFVCPSCKLHYLYKDRKEAVHIEKIVSIFNEMDAAIGDIIQQSLTCTPDNQEETNPSLSSRDNQDSNFCTNDQGAEHLGHIRTNKSCPNFQEDLENQDPDCISERSNFSDASQLELKSAIKNGKYSSMKFECDSGDKPPKRRLNMNQSSDKYTAGDGTKVKAYEKIKRVKVSDKMQFDNLQPESYQPSIVPDEPHKKIIAKKQKLSIIMESERQILATEVNGCSSKEKDIDKLSSLKKPKFQESVLTEVETKGNQVYRGLFEEEKKYRGKKRTGEEKSKTMLGDEQNFNDRQQRSSEARKYEEPISEDQGKMAKRRNDGKKKTNFKDAYSMENRPLSNCREVSKVGRTSKMQKVVGSRQSKHEPAAKYLKAGKVELSNILQRILKIFSNSEVSHPFHKLLTEREAPDYFHIIKRPMDLSTISEKIINMEYQCREDFRHDVFQITYNAHVYYDREYPHIAALADGLLELCDHHLEKRHEELSQAEDAT